MIRYTIFEDHSCIFIEDEWDWGHSWSQEWKQDSHEQKPRWKKTGFVLGNKLTLAVFHSHLWAWDSNPHIAWSDLPLWIRIFFHFRLCGRSFVLMKSVCHWSLGIFPVFSISNSTARVWRIFCGTEGYKQANCPAAAFWGPPGHRETLPTAGTEPASCLPEWNTIPSSAWLRFVHLSSPDTKIRWTEVSGVHPWEG